MAASHSDIDIKDFLVEYEIKITYCNETEKALKVMIQDALQDYITNANTKLHFITINSRILQPLFDTAFKTSETRLLQKNLIAFTEDLLNDRMLNKYVLTKYLRLNFFVNKLAMLSHGNEKTRTLNSLINSMGQVLLQRNCPDTYRHFCEQNIRLILKKEKNETVRENAAQVFRLYIEKNGRPPSQEFKTEAQIPPPSAPPARLISIFETKPSSGHKAEIELPLMNKKH